MEKGTFLGNPGHLNLILEQTIDQSSNFDSALSSLVSSPSSNPPPSNGDSLVIHELIGRLGSICNSHQSANNSCYSTPLNSPPKLNLSIASHPAHMALPARCSNFGCKGMPSGGVAQEESSGSGNAKKRKAMTKGKGKEAPLSSSITAASISPKKAGAGGLNAKRSKLSEESGAEDQSTKTFEASKDYIHVRARRGQATDSHSLAERVRREKISERMKLLQDLVPGCSKVTGKAVMLDEIINYVQLLQRQVEFLSMKLATANPLLDFSMENFVAKDIEVHQNCGTLPPHALYPLEAPSSSFSFASLPERTPTLISINGVEMESQVNYLNLGRSLSMQMPPLEGFMDASCQLGTFWDDDLRTVVQMGFNQNKESIFSSQEFQGSMTTSHMEIEL